MVEFFNSEENQKKFIEDTLRFNDNEVDSTKRRIESAEESLKKSKSYLQDNLKTQKEWQDRYANKYGKAELKRFLLKKKTEKEIKKELPKNELITGKQSLPVIKGGLSAP